MARLPVPIGSVLDPKYDIYPTSGAHLDVRFRKKGSDTWENPAFARSIIGKNIGIGDSNLPLYINDNNTWKLNPAVGAVLTSGYGPRNIFAGASKYHVGHDYSGGLLSKPGTKLSWLGNASDRRSKDSSSNTISTTDPNSGQEYEVSFLHVDPDKSPFAESSDTTGVKPSTSPTTTQVPVGNTEVNVYVGNKPGTKQEKTPQDFLNAYMKRFEDSIIKNVFGTNHYQV
jgi:hypothetical protein